MIARITGTLESVSTTSALVDVGGGLAYEVLAPACDIGKLSARLGQAILLHTLHYIDGDPSRGQVIPRLIGFLREEDREFFMKFTTVKGIGIRKALRALGQPVADIAAAIEAKDAKFLVALPEIGKRTAETIIAELNGKVGDFAAAGAIAGVAEEPVMSDAAQEAVAVLVQLGERRAEADDLVRRVLAVAPDMDDPEAIIQQAYKIRG